MRTAKDFRHNAYFFFNERLTPGKKTPFFGVTNGETISFSRGTNRTDTMDSGGVLCILLNIYGYSGESKNKIL